RLGHRSLVERAKAERRIGKPDPSVRGDDDVVRRVEPLALKTVDDDGDRPVVLGARHATPAVFTRDEPALAIARLALAVAGRVTDHRNGALRLIPFQNSIVRDVAPQETAGVPEPYRPLAPARARSQFLDASVEQSTFGELLIEDMNGRIGVN